jgi:hypothetical protein
MIKIYSKYLNLMSLTQEGFKRIFIILQFSFFIFLAYWFFHNYQPSDFGLLYKWNDHPSDNFWNNYHGYYPFSEAFWIFIKCLFVVLILLVFTFGIPLLIFKIYKFSKKLGIEKKQEQFYFLGINFFIFLLLFWLIWYQLKIIPFEKVEFDVYSDFVSQIGDSYPENNYSMIHSSVTDELTPDMKRQFNSDKLTIVWYRSNYNSKFIYDFLLIFIPFLITIVLNSVIAKLFFWIKDGFKAPN